jgi:hypothetical protein
LTEQIKFKLTISDILILAYIFLQLAILVVFKGLNNFFLPLVYLISGGMILLLALITPVTKPSAYHFIRHFTPLMLVLIFYRLIGVQLSLAGFHAKDALFYNLEYSVMGMYPSFVLQRLMEVWLNELSYAGYLSGILILIWAILRFYRRGYLDIFENFMSALVIGGILCLVIASVFPVYGPGKALEEYYYLGIYGPYFSKVVPLIMTLFTPSVGGFPSLYFCLLTIASYYLWDYGKSYIFISFVILTVVFWGGVYLRYHYLLDALAALLLAFLSATVANFIFYLKHGKNIEDTGKAIRDSIEH